MLLKTEDLIPILFPEEKDRNSDDGQDNTDNMSVLEDEGDQPVTMTEKELDHLVMSGGLERHVMDWLFSL
jgi:hypothetical protein